MCRRHTKKNLRILALTCTDALIQWAHGCAGAVISGKQLLIFYLFIKAPDLETRTQKCPGNINQPETSRKTTTG